MKTVYIGTYTMDLLSGNATGSKGIYICKLDELSGKLTHTDSVDCCNPSFICLSPDEKILLATSEMLHDGALNTYAVSAEYGLARIDKKYINGFCCCHVGYAPSGNFVTGVNYGNGDAFSCEVNENGVFGKIISDYQYSGKGVNPYRQEGPHAHSMRLLKKQKLAVVCDLGTDKLMVYRYNDIGLLTPYEKQPYVCVPTGLGPRHTEWLCDKRCLYVVGELSNQVAVFTFADDMFILKQVISTLPDNFEGENCAADIHLGTEKNYLYASNRGHNSIVQYAVLEDGTLDVKGFYSCGGRTPRNFAVTKSLLICANQDTNNVVLYRLNEEGMLATFTGELAIPAPSCVVVSNTF